MKSRLLLTLALLSLLALLSVYCGGAKQMTPQQEPNRPGWVEKGGGFFEGDKGKAFYGLGAISGMKNVSLRRTASETQARADLARVFKTHISNLVKVYQREVSDIDKSASEALAQEATKAFTSMDLSGVQIIDRYYSPAEETQYSLAVLDIAGFTNQLKNINDLSDAIRDKIISNAEKAFTDLDSLENKGK